MKQPFRVLVLDDDPNALEGIAELLRDGGYDVTPASTYQEARRLVGEAGYDLLITDVRLRSFNGLHLVIQCRREHPEMGVMIMTGYDEPFMELEAARHNAEFVRKPVRPAEFLADVARCAAKVRRPRRWPRTAIAGGFRVTVAGLPAAVTEVSYGGLRLELAATAAMTGTFDVEVTAIGLALAVEPVWSYTAPGTNALICGVALVSDSTPAARTWRAIVDRLEPIKGS